MPKKKYFVEEHSSEVQEFQCIEFTGGYDSIYGDGTLVECEFCQYCFKKMIEKFMRISEVW
jgi:hypothetical protein